MKTFLFSVLLSVVVLSGIAAAQEPSALQRDIEYQLRKLQSPRDKLALEANWLASSHHLWTGQGTSSNLLSSLLNRNPHGNDGPEAILGLTEEQKQRLSFLTNPDASREWVQQKAQNMQEEFRVLSETFNATTISDDYFFERATEKQKNAYREAFVEEITSLTPVRQKEVQEILTPEQMLQVRKWEMQLMPEVGIPSPAMFGILDLTDNQSEEMNKIIGELKIEHDRFVIEAADLVFEREAAAYRLLQGKSFESREEFEEVTREIRSRTYPHGEIQKSFELEERGIKLMTLLQTRLMNVLTDAQLDKMQNILDEAPEFIKRKVSQSKAEREARKKSPGYAPGPDSWRPGMPMPVEFKEQRQGRFPRVNQGE